ncbi:MAG: hypothetical protein ACK58T_08275, partial [Phycisphaerae bacterium]
MKKSTLLVVIVAALAGGIAFFAIRSFLGPKPEVTGGPLSATTDTAPLPGSATPDTGGAAAPASRARAIPEVLPDFTLATLEGPPRALSSYQY